MIINIKSLTGINLLSSTEIPHMQIYSELQKIPEVSHLDVVEELKDSKYSNDHFGLFHIFDVIEEKANGLTIVLY